jgi:glycosyltransferase involved in cell wall biosynthesis
MQAGLKELGHEADVMLYEPGISGYDVYHAWNATRVGGRLVQDGVNPEQIVATWTGTDLWQDWVRDPALQKQRLDPIRYQVTFTEDGRSRLIENASNWEERVVVIPPSVDVEHFEPDGPHADAPHPLILVAGGVRPVKRSAWAVDLVEALRESTGQDYHLAVAGPIREAGEWKRVQQKAALRPWVHLLGNLSRDEMPAWYRACDVLLNTSEVEGVSNAIMEAMSCGALVLVTDIKGNLALVTPERTGLVFSGQDSFIAKMREVEENSDAVAAIRQQARRQIVSRHSVHHEAKRYERLYEGCLSVRGCRC